jgi:hypothetical protein
MFAAANDAVVLNGAAVQFSYSAMKGTYHAWVRFRTILSPDQLHQPVVSASGPARAKRTSVIATHENSDDNQAYFRQ